METTTLWLSLIAVCLLVVLSYIYHCVTYDQSSLPKGLSWGGFRPGSWFIIPRASFTELWRSRYYIQDGYDKCGKHGKAYLTPNRNWEHEVVLPQEYVKWLIDLPESVVATYKILLFDVGFLYVPPPSTDLDRPFHMDALKRMNWKTITMEMGDEIDVCTKRYLGDDPGKKVSFDLNSTMWLMISHITSRAFLGYTFAHDEAYLSFTNTFVTWMLPVSIAIRTFLPSILWYPLWYIFAPPIRFYTQRCIKSLHAEVNRQIVAAGCKIEPPSPTILQNMARCAIDSPNSNDREPAMLIRKILALNVFDAMGTHTTAVTAMKALSDILLQGPELWASLRDEATTVLTESGSWSKVAISRLVLLDSVLRESLRFTAFKARSVERQVIAEEGTTLPDGTFLPYATPLGVPTVDIHLDARFFDHPETFVADRFVGKSSEGLVNISTTFLAFGLGRHACPGRFFAAHLMKLLFAHLVLNYDFDALSKRPDHRWASDFYLPKSVTLTCRRRGEELESKKEN